VDGYYHGIQYLQRFRVAVSGTFGDSRAKHGDKVLKLRNQNAIVDADDIAPNQELNVVVRTLAVVQEPGQVANHGGNFQFRYIHGGRRSKAQGNATDTAVQAVGQNKSACGVHTNPFGEMDHAQAM
jgi:hypothetical protein